jgi:hypothetical protein
LVDRRPRGIDLRNLIQAAILIIGFTSSALAQVSSALFVDHGSKKVTYLGTFGGGVLS